MRIRKNGKTINLSETEAKKIINRYKINKFLNESIPPLVAKGGIREAEEDDEGKIAKMGKKIRNIFIKEFGEGWDPDAGEKSDLLSALLKPLHKLRNDIKKKKEGEDKKDAHKKVDE